MRRAWAVLLLACALAPAVLAQGLTPLTCGTVLATTLPGTGKASFGITVQAGDAILLRVLDTDPNTNFQLSGVQIADSTGRQINPRPQALQIGANFAAEYDLSFQGTYNVQVTGTVVGGMFSIVYTTLNRPCNAPTLNCGVSALGQITVPLQLAGYQFQVNAGDVVSVLLGQYQPFAKGFSISALAYDPTGHVLTLANGSPAAVTTGGASLAQMIFPVSSAGMVTIIVLDAADQTGNYALSVVKLTGACNNTRNLTCGSISQGTIVSQLGTDSYAIGAQAGDVINLRVASVGTDGTFVPRATVYDPQGNQVTVIQSQTISGHSSSSGTFNAKSGGAYLVFVSDAVTGFNTGSYVLAFNTLNRPCSSSQSALSCASLVNGSISGLLANNLYTLPASAGDNYLLRILRTDQGGGSFRPRVDVYDPTGNSVQFLSTPTVGQLTFSTAVAGSYTLIVTDGYDNSQTGSYSLGLVRLNRPCGAATLNCGAVTSAVFSVPLTTNVYTYTANAGESFSLRMLDVNGTLQPGLAVYDPSGNPVGQPISGNFTGIDVPQPKAGAYTIVVTDNSPAPVGGPFEVDLLRTVNACGTAPPEGTTAQGVISGAQPFQSYSMAASAGDSLLVRSSAFSPGFTALMEIYDPTGSRLSASTYSIARSITTAGNYTVIVGPSAPRTSGAYALSWQLLNNPVAPGGSPAPLACGGSTTASLTQENQFHYYLASANAGDLMRLVFTPLSSAFSPSIELYDPTGARLAASPNISQKAAATGNYLVIVGPSSSIGQTGSFTVAYQRPNNPCSPASLTCGQTSLRQVNLAGQMDAYTFNATAGNVMDIKLTPRSGNYSPYGEIYDASGTLRGTVAAGDVQITAAASSAYALLVRDLNGSVGSYRVGLQNNTNACQASDTEPPVVTLLKPTGGEVITGGSTYQIQWQSDDNVGVSSQAISLSTDGGKTFATSIASGLSGNQQSYTWIVPATIPPSRTAMMRVTATDAAGNSQSAVSGTLSVIGSGFTPNSTTNYVYDGLNRITQASLGDGRTVTYTWDLAGNLISIAVAGQ